MKNNIFTNYFMFNLCLLMQFALVACSDVKFSKDNQSSECQNTNNNCVSQNGDSNFDYTVTVSGGKVDILIVNDNSASMSFEQKRLAPRFADFIKQLDDRFVDYRLAMTTTDIADSNNEARTINQNGSLQNGNLISFGSGYKYLTPQITDRQTRFNNTIVRPETLQCEKFIADWIKQNGLGNTESNASYSSQYKQNCPSGDERGVYAANMTMKNNPDSFLRSDAHLSIIFLSDEDERSGLYNQSGYELTTLDQPADLIKNINDSLGSGKSTSIHSIIVKDTACLNQQNSQILGDPGVSASQGFVRGSIGNLYLTFSQSKWGKAVDICSSDYTSQLGQISASIIDQIDKIQLKCDNPKDLLITVSSSDTNLNYTVSGRSIDFNKKLPIGTSIKLKYSCSGI